jgi:hypothetical protein
MIEILESKGHNVSLRKILAEEAPMTLGEFRTVIRDLPDAFRVTLVIGQDIVPSWITRLKLNIQRIDRSTFDTISGKRSTKTKVILTIDLDDLIEEDWSVNPDD